MAGGKAGRLVSVVTESDRMLYRKRLPCGCRALFEEERLTLTVRVSPFRLQRCLRHMSVTPEEVRAEYLAPLEGIFDA